MIWCIGVHFNIIGLMAKDFKGKRFLNYLVYMRGPSFLDLNKENSKYIMKVYQDYII